MSQHGTSTGKYWAGFKFVRGDALLNLSELTRYQDCGGSLVDGSDVEYPVLISHRWTAAEHPDPDGTQLRALQQFVNTLADVALVLFASPVEQRKAVPTLAKHGVLQAAILAGRFICSHNIPRDRDSFLRGVGVWYDFTCLPQKPRSDAEQELFKASLGRLFKLFSSAPVLSMRQNDRDDYMSRGWCLAEVASGDRSDFTPLSLWMDTQGKSIDLDRLKVALEAGAETGYNAWARYSIEHAVSFVHGWGVSASSSDNSTDTASKAGGTCTRAICTSQTDQCRLDACCLHGNFGVWCAQSLVASQVTATLSPETADAQLTSSAQVSTKLGVVMPIFSPGFDVSNDINHMIKLREIEPPFDVGELLAEKLDEQQIYCTNGDDVAMAGAWLLRSGSIDESFHSFFVELHERVLQGMSLLVVRLDLVEDSDFDGQEVINATYAQLDDEVADEGRGCGFCCI